jgi:ubiquinone/menaquinone biosynthesis C-methylase UbiE
MTTTLADATYTMGRTAAETRRLVTQARLYDRSTRRLFEDAGLTRGMKVLDVGSGAGAVALLAAELVGPGGSVVGVDSNPEVLETARARARAAGLANVTFLTGDFRTLALPDDFDAAVGRLVLLYVADPAEALRVAAGRVRAGGIVAFQEPDLSLPHAWGAAGLLPPFARQLWAWVYRVFAASGAHVAMGTQLPSAFERAGLGAPELSLYAPLGGAADWPGFAYAQESFRSLLPLLEEFRVATAADVDVDTLAARWRAEVARTRVPAILTPLVAAWARVPAPGA